MNILEYRYLESGADPGFVFRWGLKFIYILFISFDFIVYMGQQPRKITLNFYYTFLGCDGAVFLCEKSNFLLYSN